MKFLFLLIPIIFLSSCSSPQKAVEDAGYEYIKSNGTIFFSCSKDDNIFASEEVVAKNSNGKEVTLKVCCGLLFKGCTIRY